MCIAIECSYKLDQKMNLNSCVNYAHFRKSGHIYIITFSYLILITCLLTSSVFLVPPECKISSTKELFTIIFIIFSGA